MTLLVKDFSRQFYTCRFPIIGKEKNRQSVHSSIFCRLENRQTFIPPISCRPVALWFYNLVSDHNATDPVMKKVAIYGADFFAHFNDLLLHF
jgi:hypothetical protein